MNSTWFTIEHVEGVAYVRLFGDIGCLGTAAADFALALGEAQTVELSIDSLGGDSVCGFALFDLLSQRHATATVYRAGSAAVTVMLACQQINMMPEARILIHSPVEYVCGDPAYLRQCADGLDRHVARLAAIISQRTEKPLSKVKRWLSCDTWLTADEALAIGLVDSIIQPAKFPRPVSTITIDRVAQKYAMPESEQVFRSLLAAFGTVETADKAAFLNHLRKWAHLNIIETATLINP